MNGYIRIPNRARGNDLPHTQQPPAYAEVVANVVEEEGSPPPSTEPGACVRV